MIKTSLLLVSALLISAPKALASTSPATCDRLPTSHLEFSLICHAPNDPLQLSFHLFGELATPGYTPYNSADILSLTRLDIMQNGQKTQELSLGSRIPPSAAESALELIDINFDGYNDIKLQIDSMPNGNAVYNYWLYTPQIRQFEESALGLLLSGTGITADADTQTLIVGAKSGYSWVTNTYRWQEGKLVLVNRVVDGDFNALSIPPLAGRDNLGFVSGKQTYHYNEQQELVRIEVEPGSLVSSEEEGRQVNRFKPFIDALKEEQNGYTLHVQDNDHFTIEFNPPLPMPKEGS